VPGALLDSQLKTAYDAGADGIGESAHHPPAALRLGRSRLRVDASKANCVTAAAPDG
jgi:hypothetical protein